MTETEERQLLRKVDEIHIAVIGKEELGLPGLVTDVDKLKKWKAKLDLRIMLISGFIAGVAFIIRHLFTKQP